jgi:hypothetical protein
VSLNPAHEQNNFSENGGGPYVHVGNYFNILTGAVFPLANGPQIFTGNGWSENIPDPWNIGSLPAKGSAFGNYKNAVSTSMMTDSYMRSDVTSLAIPSLTNLTSLKTGTNTNTDMLGAGRLDVSGNFVLTFTGTYTQNPRCFIQNSVTGNAIGASINTTTLTLNGPSLAFFSWFCFFTQ